MQKRKHIITIFYTRGYTQVHCMRYAESACLSEKMRPDTLLRGSTILGLDVLL